ncbi:MAG: AAA family ATPase [Thioploca sp.]|nr:AAA family ATPase [Thioploca sp.]
MKLTKLTIQNFRGIQTLDIKDFQRVNLLVGRNNCGKTSVLEALFLISSMSNPQSPVNIHFLRDLGFIEGEDFSYLFFNFDLNQLPQIAATVKEVIEKQRTLTIKPLYASYISANEKELQKKDLGPFSDQAINVTTSTLQFMEGIQLDFKEDQRLGHAEVHLKEGQFKFSSSFPDLYKESLRCIFLVNRIGMRQPDIYKRLDRLRVQKSLQEIISVLKEIESGLSDIHLGANDIIYADIGLDKLIPLNLLGDGIRHLLTILSAVFEAKNGILLIDEIENGLHYTSLKTLWKAVFRAAQDFNVQIFATTHSYECIEAFANSEFSEIALYRIDRSDGKHQAFCYSAEVLRAGVEKEFEVR